MAMLACDCGATVRVVEVLYVTPTGRETLAAHCRDCDQVSYWWRVRHPEEQVMLIDYLERPDGARKWPPPGWCKRLHKH